MSLRIDYAKTAPDAVKGMYATNAYLDGGAIDQGLRRFVELLVSHINGCRYCIWLHSRQARELNEPEERIAAVENWRNADCFSPAERAALDWTEAVTRISEGVPSDALYGALRDHFDEPQIVDLTVAVASMNALNRVGISMRLEPPE